MRAFFSFTMTNPGSSLRFNTHWSAPPVSSLARSEGLRKMSQLPVSRNSNIKRHMDRPRVVVWVIRGSSGHKVGESYGASVGKAEISCDFQKEKESVGVKRTKTSRRFRKQRKDCGTNSESFEMLNCEGLSEFNLCSAVLCCVVLPSPLALPFFIV